MIGYIVLIALGIMMFVGFAYLSIAHDSSFKKDVELFKHLK